MGVRSGEGQLGVLDGPGEQARAERRRGLTGDGVGVGEEHVGGHPVGVELLVPDDRVVGALQALFVVGLPAHDVVVVEGQRLLAVGGPLGQVLLEGREVPAVEVGAVVLAGQAGMPVGRDDDVAVARRGGDVVGRGLAHRFAPSTLRSS